MTDEMPAYRPIDGFDPLPLINEHGLTIKQAYFVGWYLITLNATKAARNAGYSEPCHVSGNQALHSKGILNALDVQFADRKMRPSEILDRLKSIANADISDYLIVDPQFAEEHDGVFKLVSDGRVLDGIWINLRQALKDGNTGAIKSYKRVKGETVIELHDKTRALELLGKHYRLFADVLVSSPKPDGTAKQLEDDTLEAIAREGLRDNAASDVSYEEPL